MWEIKSHLDEHGVQAEKAQYRQRDADKQPLRVIAFGGGVDFEEREYDAHEAEDRSGADADHLKAFAAFECIPMAAQLAVEGRRKFDLQVEFLHRAERALGSFEI